MTSSQRNHPAARGRRTTLTAAALTATTLIAACGGTGTPDSADTETTYPPVSAFPDEAATGWDDGWAISLTADGGAVIAGGFTGNATFGGTELRSAGGIDLYVAKLDADGNWQWATSAGGPADDEAYGVTVTSTGEIAVAGYVQDTATFGADTVTSRGGSDLVVAELDADGNWQWAISAGGADYDRARNITSDTSGNLYVTGWYWQNAEIGPEGTTLTSAGYGDTYVAKLDTDGNWQWATSGGGAFYDRGLGLDTTDDRILLTGFFYGDAMFGPNQLRSAGDGDIYVAELDANGNWQWAVRAGSFDYDEAYAAKYTPDGAIAVYGSIGGATAEFGSLTATSAGSDDIFAAKLDATGNWQWVLRAGGPNRDEGYAMTVDAEGDLLVTGTFRDQVRFGDIDVVAGSGSAIFTARVSPDGVWRWVGTAGSGN
jgi:hypothetical protein